MSWRRPLRKLLALIPGRRDRIEAELADELQAHLELEEEAQRAAGLSPAEARAAARRAFGNVTRAREQTREGWIFRWLEVVIQDGRHALRALRKTPAFTAVALATLALGIGANTAIFSLLDQVSLRPLPADRPHDLVLLKMRGPHHGDNTGPNAISYPMYRDFQRHNQVFTGMGARYPETFTLTTAGGSERVSVELVSGSYFDVLGVGAALGRTLGPEDDVPGDPRQVAVLSHDHWRVRFGADPHIVGKAIVVNGVSVTVLGVVRPGFDGMQLGHAAKIFVPLSLQPALKIQRPGVLTNRRVRWVNAFGRLRPGVDLGQARAGLAPLMRSMLEKEVREPAFNRASSQTRLQFLTCWIDLLPGSRGQSFTRDALASPLWLLMATAALVLIIACANLANLLLARGSARGKEIAVRLALGAGRGRIVGQLLVESLVLSLLGGLLGLVLAYWGDKVLLALYLPNDSGNLKISAAPDGRILLFVLVVTVVTALGFGLVPALRATRTDLISALKTPGGSAPGGRAARLRKGLALAQMTLSLVLLVGAGLFLRTLHNLRAVSPGFPTGQLLGFRLNPTLSGYDLARTKAFYQRLTDELGNIPGVASVGLASMRILSGSDWDAAMTVKGYVGPDGRSRAQPLMNQVGPGYFRTLGAPLVVGRDFTTADTVVHRYDDRPDQWAPAAVIVNESFARRYFAGRSPIGGRLGWGTDPGTPTDMEIVGVVKDIKYLNLREEIGEQAFLPYLASDRVGSMSVFLRITVDAAKVTPAVRARIRALDPTVAIYGLRSMEEEIHNSITSERLIASLCAVFGALATLLAMIGLYGVMSYSIATRTREIGIRMALGAGRRRVMAMVMNEVIVLVAVGAAAGVLASLALTRTVASQLYGVDASDPVTLVLATLALTLAAGAAGYLPARRASRVDPMAALRHE
jgi:predicted permease